MHFPIEVGNGYTRTSTFSTPGLAACSNAATPSSRLYQALISGRTSTVRWLNARIAGAKGPQREPCTRISSITIVARCKVLLSATVLFKISVPPGLTSRSANSSPCAVPLHSTTRSTRRLLSNAKLAASPST